MRRRQILATCGLATLLVAVPSSVVSAVPDGLRAGVDGPGQMALTPTEGPPGSVVTIESVTPCPPSPDSSAQHQVTVQVLELPVLVRIPPEGGSWTVQTAIGGGAPLTNVAEIRAQCDVFPDHGDGQTTLVYEPAFFTVTERPVPPAPPAPQVPAGPRFTG